MNVDPSLLLSNQTSIPTTLPYNEEISLRCGFISPHVGSPMPSQSMPLQMPSNISSPQLGHVAQDAGSYESVSNAASLSPRSHPSPSASNTDGEDEGREKSRCPFPECGRSFKDLRAHMLTHQSERPEKCPIVNCEYHLKGFARKYDKNRHTLTHYKGTMVCGFCPGSGSAAEKSFNRADVFKRHLMSVHGVEQTAPNCRKRSPPASSKTLAAYSNDATGKCSTCSGTFSNAQDFYEHLDDCVLRVVQQEEPSEAINQKRLAEVAGDDDVKQTMEKHKQLDSASPVASAEHEEEDDDDEDDDFNRRSRNSGQSQRIGPSGAITKPKARPATRRRGNRNSYPQGWGTPAAKMKTKKRVLCVYDGQRRLWKDEMMLDNEFEVRIRLPGGAGDGTNRDAYVTDLDVETVKRANGIFSATEEERGPWVEGPSDRLMGQPYMLFPEISQVDGVDIEELMAYKEKTVHDQ
jgi:hypothetical protein